MLTIPPQYSTTSALTITLGGLASSAVGVGRQSTMVDNRTTRYKRIYLHGQITLGTSPASNAPVSVYLLRYDDLSIRTDGSGATDAAITVKNAELLGILTTGPSAATGDVLKGDFVIERPGKWWGVAVVQGSNVALNATNGNHPWNWYGELPEILAA